MKNTDLILSQILLATIEGRATALKVWETVFDSRNHLVISPRTSAIAVMLSFYNEHWLLADEGRKIRRRLTLILADDTGTVHFASKTVTLKTSAREICPRVGTHLPFKAASLPLDRDYSLIVMDAQTGEQLDCRTFHALPHKHCGRDIETVFSAEEAGLASAGSGRMFSALDVRPGAYADVRFNLQYNCSEPLEKLPEIEIRLYFPDGSFTHRYRPAVCDDYDAGEYHVSMPFLVTSANHGTVYAEALINDYAFAGVVFRTEGDEQAGGLTGKYADILAEYSPEAANKRFEEQKPEEEFTAEDFDRRLDEFIKSEMGEAGEDGNAAEEEEETLQEESAEPFDLEMQQLVGLTEVKQRLSTYQKLMSFNAMRARAGLPVTSAPLHAMFLGSPGTGKTTVAKMVGKMLHRVGLLSMGHVVVRERATLSGTHYGDQESLTLKALEEAKGGILFIDEAYQLFQQNDPKDPGRLVLETLLTAMADEDNRDWMLILAGYPDEMLRLFNMNPGLRSRIPEPNIYTFADFSEPELMEIADRWFARNQYTLTADARRALATRLNADYSARNRSFGNARHVVNLIETSILPSMAARIMEQESPDRESLTDILPCDIPSPCLPLQSPRRRIGFESA